MTVDIDLLRLKISESGMTIPDFSAAIGINPSTFYRKIDAGGLKFTVGQMHETSAILKLSKKESCDIFLSDISQ